MIFSKPVIGYRERSAVTKVLKSGQLAQGVRVSELEKAFAELHGAKFGVAVNSGTSALHLALLAAGIRAGHEVIVPAISFAATANAVAITGAKPVFVDISINTFNVDIKKIRAAITPRTKAIVPVHLFGNPVDIDELDQIAKDHNLIVIQDSAQAHLTTLRGKHIGGRGVAAAYSFYGTKNMTTGEGGIVLTNDEALAEKVRWLRNQGMSGTYVYEIVGLNNRMTEISAAIGLAQLKRLESFTRAREANAAKLDAVVPESWRPIVVEGSRHPYHQYTFLVPHSRSLFSEQLGKLGIPTRIFYPQALSSLKTYNGAESIPESLEYVAKCLSVPVGPHLSGREVNRIVSSLREVVSNGW
jgi:dTDP-4-amino-4,6-dideoxygalactose transaminase